MLAIPCKSPCKPLGERVPPPGGGPRRKRTHSIEIGIAFQVRSFKEAISVRFALGGTQMRKLDAISKPVHHRGEVVFGAHPSAPVRKVMP